MGNIKYAWFVPELDGDYRAWIADQLDGGVWTHNGALEHGFDRGREAQRHMFRRVVRSVTPE